MMSEAQKINRGEGAPADMSVFGGAAICNLIVNKDLVNADGSVIGYAWWTHTTKPILHRHVLDEVVYVVSGECVHLGEGTHLAVKQGDFVHVPGGYWHGIYVPKDGHVELVVIFGGGGTMDEVGFETCPQDLQDRLMAGFEDSAKHGGVGR